MMLEYLSNSKDLCPTFYHFVVKWGLKRWDLKIWCKKDISLKLDARFDSVLKILCKLFNISSSVKCSAE